VIFLLDTDTFIYLVRGLKIAQPPNERQRKRLAVARHVLARCRSRQEAGEEVGLSAITVAELEFGARNSEDYVQEIAAVRKILTPFSTYDFDAALCAVAYGEVRHFLEKQGTPIGAMDLLIAAHAKALGATLVTNNTSHFVRIPGLKAQNWSASG
jgi:tRNA(fMet)-specific endonuclease VapC